MGMPWTAFPSTGQRRLQGDVSRIRGSHHRIGLGERIRTWHQRWRCRASIYMEHAYWTVTCRMKAIYEGQTYGSSIWMTPAAVFIFRPYAGHSLSIFMTYFGHILDTIWTQIGKMSGCCAARSAPRTQIAAGMYLVRGADGAFGAIHAGGIYGADYMRQRLGAATRDFIERYMQGRYLGITCGAGIWAGHQDAAYVRLLPWGGHSM